jgi:hypothetical protein
MSGQLVHGCLGQELRLAILRNVREEKRIHQWFPQSVVSISNLVLVAWSDHTRGPHGAHTFHAGAR